MTDPSEVSGKPAGLATRLIATLFAGVLIVLVIPLAVRSMSHWIDSSLGIPALQPFPLVRNLGLILAFSGGLFALWPIALQLFMAEGTPIPILPTQRLLTTGPFRFSRNPMALGSIFLYLGLAIWFNSWSALALVVSFSAFLLLYIRRVEEPELERKFGEDYRQFQRDTPFLIPMPNRGQLPGDPGSSYGRDQDA